jgi:AraC-like DNA-binding protein/mannose-6-phosphate isomerase-like protein (cupin superfamily)
LLIANGNWYIIREYPLKILQHILSLLCKNATINKNVILTGDFMNTFYQNNKDAFRCYQSINLTYPSHLHKQLEILFVLSGSITVTIENKSSVLNKGDVSVCFPNTIHSLCTLDSSCILLLIFDRYLVDISGIDLSSAKPINPFLKSNELHNDIPYCLHAMLELKEPLESLYIDSKQKAYLSLTMCRLLELLTFAETSSRTLNYSADLELIHNALVFIDNHYNESLTLGLVAERLNTSKYYLSRSFNKQLNISFQQYLNRQRLQEAQYLLENSRLTVTEISYQTGFESMRTFYRVFQEVYKMSPTAYRNKGYEGLSNM